MVGFLKKIPPIRHIKDNIEHYKDLRKVFSFSLYGNVQKYFKGLLLNCTQINKIYPDFWIYVYLGNDFDKIIMDNKFDEFKNLVFIETEKSGHEVASYRFFAIDRPEVGIMLSRDLDSQINARDQYCINEFLKSDKKFQIIRDHPAHGTHILAGMWGIKKGLLNFNIEHKFSKFLKEGDIIFGSDQMFLSIYIYPLIKQNAIIFDEYFHYDGESRQKIMAPLTMFPTGSDYVGRIWDDECYFTYI